MKNIITLALLLLATSLFAQINTANIVIVRDSFGVPHIYANTDAEAAYGLAWAHSEDDFEHIQHNLLSAKGLLGSVIGKEGVLFDYGMKFLGIDTFVDANLQKDLSPDFIKVMQGYVQGLNDYAAKHPDEVLMKQALPFTVNDAVKGYTLNLALMSGVGMALKAIKEDRITEFYAPNETGSNALAIAPSHTEDGKAYLLINSHQPIEGRFAWYEAHISSAEGWDAIGGLFPGGATIFVGTNKNLGWAHTTNYHTMGDIYKLEVKGGKYLYDGKWLPFATRKAKLKVKLGGIKLGVTKKLYYSEQGPVFKSKHGYYAIRFPSYRDLRAAEQWYRMNKARNWGEFEKAIRMEAVAQFNIVYSDIQGNIFWQSAGMFPIRSTAIPWKQPIPGTRSDLVWSKLLPYSEKPALFNPSCGYVFNCNQTPYNCSGDACNWKGGFIGCQPFQYNRGERFGEMMKQINGKVTWADFMRIKFDNSYCKDSSYAKRFANVYRLDENKYPDIAESIRTLKQWNWQGNTDSKGAAVAMLMHHYLLKKHKFPFAMLMIRKELMPVEEAVWALRESKKFLLKTHGTTDVTLGTIQRHIRGNINIPADGLREVNRAADAKLYDKKLGVFRIESGDGYIQMNKYSPNGVEILSINAYGASAKPSSKHYNDQMQMFQNHQFKSMTFDREAIMRNAERIYRPGE